jgi:HK97 family phage major capsid protein
MELEEIKKAIEEKGREMRSLVEAAKADAAKTQELSTKNQEKLDSMQKELEELRNKSTDTVEKETIDKMQDQLDAIDLALKNKFKQEDDSKKNVFAEIRKGLKDHFDRLQKMKSGNSAQEARDSGFSFKAAGTMSISNNVTGELPQALLLPGLNAIPSRRVRLLDIVTRGSIGSNLVKWAYQANKDGAAGATAEGADKKQIDFDILLGSQAVEKYSAFIKVSDEMIDDIDFIESEIRNELVRELLKSVELGVYSGNNTPPNLNGIRTVAPSFAAGAFATAVEEANAVDVLTVAMNQILIAEQEMATDILMHPSDVTKLKLVKVSSTDRRYVDRLITTGGNLNLDGVPIIPTTLVAAGEYLVGDFTRAFVLDRQGLNIEVGLDGNDFTKNLRTIRAEWRGVAFVKNNDRTAFVKGVFATDIAAIDKPAS